MRNIAREVISQKTKICRRKGLSYIPDFEFRILLGKGVGVGWGGGGGWDGVPRKEDASKRNRQGKKLRQYFFEGTNNTVTTPTDWHHRKRERISAEPNLVV